MVHYVITGILHIKHFSQIAPLKKLKVSFLYNINFNFFKGMICEKCFINFTYIINNKCKNN